jgi:hypothetical protein
MNYLDKFNAFKALFLNVLQPETGFHTYSDTVAEFIQTRFWDAKAANRDVLVLA